MDIKWNTVKWKERGCLCVCVCEKCEERSYTEDGGRIGSDTREESLKKMI